MIDAGTYLLYCTAALTLCVTPGPTVLMALSNAVSGGWRAAAAGIAAAMIASLVLVAAVALGLGALLAASSTLFELLRAIGVVYLCWLGFKLWQAGTFAVSAPQARGERLGARTAFIRSLTVGLSNPKALLFFTAFLPQFVDTARALPSQYATLALTFVAFDGLVLSIYALAGLRTVHLLTRRGVRLINRGCALAMFALAGALALFRRSGA